MYDALDGRTQPFGPGSLLADRYRLVRRVGRGATADVFDAVDERLARSVAIKLFHDTRDAVEQERIQNEMRTLASLHHPGLVAVFDADSVPGSEWRDEVPYLVMELVDGQSLRQRLVNGPLPPDEVSTVGRCVGEALAYVHARGFVHRDVKPANILLDDHPCDPRFSVKLADFGIARLSGSAHLTSDGFAVGTANYLSPEQVTGDEISAASDVYSLGLVLLECLSGHTAFPGTGVEAALARLHRDPDIPRHVAPGWRSLITQMTWRDPAARLSAAEVVARLGDVAMSSATSAFADGGPSTLGVDTAVAAGVAADTLTLDAITPAPPDQIPGQAPVAHTAVLPELPALAAAALPRRRRSWLGAAIAAVSVGLVVLLIATTADSSGPLVPPPSNSSVPPANVAPVTSHVTSHSTTPPATHSTTHAPAPSPKPPKHGHGHGGAAANQEG